MKERNRTFRALRRCGRAIPERDFAPKRQRRFSCRYFFLKNTICASVPGCRFNDPGPPGRARLAPRTPRGAEKLADPRVWVWIYGKRAW